MSRTQIQIEIERRGDWLFRYRSYLPMVLLPFAITAMATNHYFKGISPVIEFIPEVSCFCLALIGICVRALTLGYAQHGTSGRNTKLQIADNLNTTEMYSVVRHPLYLGNLIMVASLLLFTRSVFFIVAGMLAYWAFYVHVSAAEEKYLLKKFGSSYTNWAAQTPFLVPRLSQWRSSTYSFEWTACLRSEAYSLIAVVTSFLILDGTEHWFRSGVVRPHWFWLNAWTLTFLFWIVMRHLRKHSHVLDSRAHLA